MDARSDMPIFRFIEEHNIQLIGISLMSSEFYRASYFAKEIKHRFNHIPLVFGGIHATIAPDDCLSVGDIAVRGEGEHILLDLVRCLEKKEDYRDMPGICFHKQGHVHTNPPRSLEKDIDIFPFPQHLPQGMYVVHKNHVIEMDLALFNAYSRYNGTFPNIITTRGCPYSCTYCSNSAYKNLYGKKYNRVRKRSVASVITECAEIKMKHKNCLSMNIQDDCFLTYDEEWISDFSEQYRNKVNLPLIVRTTPRHITREKLDELKKAGLAVIMIGLQSGSNRINKEIYRRNVTSKHFLDAANLVHDVGLVGYYDIILDNPYETEEDVLKTLEIVLKIRKPFQFQLFSLCFYQGTELHQRAMRDGLSFTDPRVDNYAVLSCSSLNKLIRMVPTVPAPVIRFFAGNRNNKLVITGLNFMDVLNTAILRPLSLLRIIHRAYGSHLYTTMKIAKNFAKTAIDRMQG